MSARTIWHQLKFTFSYMLRSVGFWNIYSSSNIGPLAFPIMFVLAVLAVGYLLAGNDTRPQFDIYVQKYFPALLSLAVFWVVLITHVHARRKQRFEMYERKIRLLVELDEKFAQAPRLLTPHTLHKEYCPNLADGDHRLLNELRYLFGRTVALEAELYLAANSEAARMDRRRRIHEMVEVEMRVAL